MKTIEEFTRKCDRCEREEKYMFRFGDIFSTQHVCQRHFIEILDRSLTTEFQDFKIQKV